MKFRFSLKYFLLTIFIFLIEFSIATVFKDWFFVRAYLGDVIVVMLIYTFILTFFEVRNKDWLVLGILIFSVVIEFLQHLKLAEVLGFQEGSIGYIVIGNSFSCIDILCYGVGCLLIWLIKKIRL